jgi:GMP synthase (glutamine-hydrolysing)
MSQERIALLNASYDGYNTRRNVRRELGADLVEYDVTERETPETFAFDAFVVTGSRASVYWDEPWIDDVAAWAEEAIERGLPALGVCWGHQLLADVLDGTVEDMGEYEIGYRTVRQTGDSPLFESLDREFVAFETHSDRVSELPPGADLIAENEYGIQGFQLDDVFAVQFHPEYDQQTAREVTRGKESLSDERIQSVLDGIDDENYAAACETKRLFCNFRSYVRTHRDSGDQDTNSERTSENRDTNSEQPSNAVDD